MGHRAPHKKLCPMMCRFQMGFHKWEIPKNRWFRMEHTWLVVWNMNKKKNPQYLGWWSNLTFTPSFFRGVGIPPTRYHQIPLEWRIFSGNLGPLKSFRTPFLVDFLLQRDSELVRRPSWLGQGPNHKALKGVVYRAGWRSAGHEGWSTFAQECLGCRGQRPWTGWTENWESNWGIFNGF